MNPAKYNEYEYINFLIASPRVYSCTEAARVQPEQENPPAHDAITRLLHRLVLGSDELWAEATDQVDPKRGVMVLDDSTLDKQYAKQIELVARHWSGKHHRVVSGINLISLLWRDGERHIPCDYRLYDKLHDGLSQNDHFRAMLATAKQRGFEPEYMIFDSWHSSLANLKAIGGYGWTWLTRLKSNTIQIRGGSGISKGWDGRLKMMGGINSW